MTTPDPKRPTSGDAAEASRRKRIIWTNVALVAAFIAIVALAFALLRPQTAPPASGGSSPSSSSSSDASVPTVRADSHVLGEPGTSGVTVVEFLDFECEACGAFFPLVEQLREEYAGEVTFVTRYFPLDGHLNSRNAAVAAEAAAQQGAFEPMYAMLFETQAEWGEQRESRAPLFREFAAELGLDLDAYDAAVADPATLERVESDRIDGIALGVQSTPTFFVDDEMLRLEAYEDLGAGIEAELAGE
ncbi:DsbA family protein [Agromyces italicus]|uniref:DsbA family protein n=1 Tax=Agromyces italicus TaxID=279572 RepID=UPI0003B47E43|nr:thioredoxin domain-containing protein [Agromyces italicus]